MEDPTVEYEAKLRALGEELEGVRKTCSARVKTLEVCPRLDVKELLELGSSGGVGCEEAGGIGIPARGTGRVESSSSFL